MALDAKISEQVAEEYRKLLRESMVGDEFVAQERVFATKLFGTMKMLESYSKDKSSITKGIYADVFKEWWGSDDKYSKYAGEVLGIRDKKIVGFDLEDEKWEFDKVEIENGYYLGMGDFEKLYLVIDGDNDKWDQIKREI